MCHHYKACHYLRPTDWYSRPAVALILSVWPCYSCFCTVLDSLLVSLLFSIYVTTKYGNWTLNLRYVRQTLVPAQYCVSLPFEALILSFWPFYPCFCDFLVFILSWSYPWLTRYYYLLLNRLQTSTFNAWAFTKSTQLSLFIVVLSLPRVFLSIFSSVLVVPLVNYYNWTLRLLNAQSPVPTIHKSLSTAAQWSYLFNVVLTFTNFSCLSSLLSSWYHGPTTTNWILRFINGQTLVPKVYESSQTAAL